MALKIHPQPTIDTITDICNHIQISQSSRHDKVPAVVNRLLNSWSTKECYDHISPVSIPSHDRIIEIVQQARRILFPGYFTRTRLHAANLEYYIGKETTDLYEKMSEQIVIAIRHDCRRNNLPCTNCEELSQELTLAFIETLPDVTAILATDIRAALEGDPATDSPDEVIFSYPGLLAISIFRLAHELFRLKVPIVPRIMTEYAHSLTGIDIHPGATIGEGFFIDHGTGVVIGETTVIGNNVRLYQGVTLGALSLPRDAGTTLRHRKRHPTIEDDVIIYANTTILGGDTVIGRGAVIGGNIWLTESVEAGTRVILKRPELIYANGRAR
ncbi:MAG: serine acetyltransferase [Desulfoprunum sp.]|jgi:serine O-acetyltransferase|uniref:serine O-acetyltransferase n=1 Tax=Desulfoprunum sp. TaxID=2020866 RepID=UPI003C779829